MSPTSSSPPPAFQHVGPTAILAHHRASCHCGAVVLALDLPDGVVNPRRCDCSFCRRRGTIIATVPLARVQVLQGQDVLRTYQFNTLAARHHFCSVCGIHVYHQRRSNPSDCGINVACLEGVNPFDLGPVPTIDGVNHAADRPPTGTHPQQEKAA